MRIVFFRPQFGALRRVLVRFHNLTYDWSDKSVVRYGQAGTSKTGNKHTAAVGWRQRCDSCTSIRLFVDDVQLARTILWSQALVRPTLSRTGRHGDTGYFTNL